jgi:hypothetical protein
VYVAVEDDHRVKNMHLLKVTGVSIDTIFTTLNKDLALTQKSARWMSKFLTKEQKHEVVRIRKERFLTTTTQRFVNCLLFSLPKGERATGQHHPDPGHLQRQLGTGHQDHLRLRSHRCLPPIVRAKQKVCLHRR